MIGNEGGRGKPQTDGTLLVEIESRSFCCQSGFCRRLLGGEQKQQQVRSREVTVHLTPELWMLLLESYIQQSRF